MSTNIFITGLQQLQRRLQEAADANRRAALEREARDVRLQVFASTPTSPINEPVRPIRSLLKGAGPTAQRAQDKRRVAAEAEFELGTCTLSTTEYLYNSNGSVFTEPIRDITRRAMKLSVGTSGNVAATVQIDVYDRPHFNPNRGAEGEWFTRTGNVWDEFGNVVNPPDTSGVQEFFYQSNNTTSAITYLALPIGDKSCILCVGTRYLTFDETSMLRSRYINGPLYTPPEGGETYDQHFSQYLDYYTNTDSQNYAYYAWIVTPTSITATALPAGVEDVLQAELGDGILVRNFVGYDNASTIGGNKSSRSIDSSGNYTDDPYASAGFVNTPFRENWNYTGTPQYPIFRSQYAGLTNLGIFADEYPSVLLCQGFGPGTATAIEEGNPARLWLIGADRSPAAIVSEYLTGDPVPSQSYVIDYSASEGTDFAVVHQPLGRLDYKIANVTGGELGAPKTQVSNAAPNWSGMPTNYFLLNDQRRRLVYWDWNQRDYCRSKATSLGFTLP